MTARASITLLRRTNHLAAAINRNYQPINRFALCGLATKTHLYRNYATAKFTETAARIDNDDGTNAAAAADTAINPEIQKLTEEIEKLTKEIVALKEKNEDLTDKYKRALADGENLRLRLTKQIADAKIFGIQSFCKDLLEVADTLGHATEAVPQDQINDKNPHLKGLYQGLTMTKASLLQVFKRHGLEQLNPLNEKFDPNYHEALFQVDNPKMEPNTVIEVTKLGYKLQDRVIRPALVGVSK